MSGCACLNAICRRPVEQRSPIVHAPVTTVSPGVRGGSLPSPDVQRSGVSTMGSTRLRDRVGGRVVTPALALVTTLGLMTFQTAAGQSGVIGQSAVTTSPTAGG